jgi:hypothetical protein
MAKSTINTLLPEEKKWALIRHGPEILKNLQLTPMFYMILRADHTLTFDMEERIKVPCLLF